MTVFPLEFPFMRAVIEPRPIIGTTRYIVGAMMTASHSRLGQRLAASCLAHGLPLALFEVPVIHRSISTAGVDDLRYTKANFVHFLLSRYGYPVLYLDADCEIVAPPTGIEELASDQVDFAIFNWFAEEHTEAYVPANVGTGGLHRTTSARYYRFSHCIDIMSETQLLCSGAVQWYSNSDAARRLLKTWHEVISLAPGRADDECLDLAVNNYPADAPTLKRAWLKKRYARYAWWIYERPVIDHPEFPTSGDGFTPLDEVAGKPRFHLELLRQVRVNHVFPKDCVIDSETRTLLRLQDGAWRPVGTVSIPLWLAHRPRETQGDDIGPVAEAKLREAMALHQQSRLDEAETAYEQVLAWQPQQVQALTFLGVLAFQGQRFERALQLATRALAVDPRSPATHLMRGHTLARLGRLDEAIASYDAAIALKSDLADAHFHRGNLLEQLGRHAQAVTSFDAAIGLAPGIAGYHLNRGLALCELKRYTESLSSFDAAIEIDPGFAEAHLSRGNVLQQLRQLEASLASYDRAIASKPDYAQAHANRGNLLGEVQRFDAALASYDAALSLDPERAEFHCNRGNALVELGRYEEARASFARAIDLDAGYAQAYYSRAFLLLLLGDFERGWRDFEWRWKNDYCVTSQERREYPQPRWLGDASLAGKTILVHCEQGLGDTIQFCRYAEVIAALGASVVFEAPKVLHGLLRSLRGVTHLIAQGDPLPTFDCWSPLMSLPMALNTRLETIPARVPYLHSRAERAQYWRGRLGSRSKMRVGLVWAGGFRPNQPELWAVNERRNIPLRQLAELKHPEVEYYSLQKGEPAEGELAQLKAQNWSGPTLIDHVSELHDFEETAALVEQLDLVISVDTSAAHLAGALGKPVWLLNRFDTCWRWLLDRSDSPWYPTLRLYRQERPGDWRGVVQRIRQDLVEVVRRGTG